MCLPERGSMVARWSGISTRARSRRSPSRCETDIVNTYRVWLRYELFRGTLSQSSFEVSERNLVDFMNGR